MEINNLLNTKPNINVLFPTKWENYKLLDSGFGAKLERFGNVTVVRPAPQAIWKKALNESVWQSADACFQPNRKVSGGKWQKQKGFESTSWQMQYGRITFLISVTDSRHLGVFPEQASHWDWIKEKIEKSQRKIRVLNLFGYTGIASLVAAQAGAEVTHVDASQKTIRIAKYNQKLSGLGEAPIRWITDDVYKFVQREDRRQSKYDGLIMDPPKFGRGPKGEVWEFSKLMPLLMDSCSRILSKDPLFVVITSYTVQASALSLYSCLKSYLEKIKGELECGELTLKENSAGRILSLAIYARWSIA